MSKAELKGKVTLNNRLFASKMRRMRRTARQWGNSMKRAGAIVRTGLLAVTAIAVGATVAIFKLVTATAKTGDELDKMALRTGLSAEALAEYGHVARITGTDLGLFQKALKSMAKFVSYTRDGLKTYTRELDKMGISMADIDGKTPDQALDLFVKKLRAMKDPLAQSAAAQIVFGRAGIMMLPLIKASGKGISELRAEFRELNPFIGKGSAKAAEFTDMSTRLKTAIAGIRDKFVLAFLDKLSGGFANVTRKIVQMRKDGKISAWAASAANAVNNFVAGARKGFAGFSTYSSAIWDKMKISGEILWDSMVVTMWSAIYVFKTAFQGLKASLKTQFNIIKEASNIAFSGMAVAGLTVAKALMSAYKVSINGIIKGLNKISGTNIKPIEMSGAFDKVNEEIAATKAGITDSVNALKLTGRAYQPIEDAAKKLKEIEAERKEMTDKHYARLKKNLKLYVDFETLAEADLKYRQEIARLNAQHAKVAAGIAAWEKKGAELERDKADAAGDAADALNAQSDALRGQVALRGIFGRPVELGENKAGGFEKGAPQPGGIRKLGAGNRDVIRALMDQTNALKKSIEREKEIDKQIDQWW